MTPALDSALRDLLGSESMREATGSSEYLRDATDFQGLRGRADAVVAPASAGDVARLVEWCYRNEVAMVPRGGGTGLSGGAVPIDGGVVISLERLDQVLSFEPELWRVRVQAGVTTARLHTLARANGLMFPPDPGASEQSQVGGNIACNAGGPRGFKYGVTRHWVSGVTAVIEGGQVISLGGPTRKDVAGYDLCSLMVGSEGTLGVITDAWLRLTPAPECTVHVVACYSDIPQGVAAVLRVLGSGLVPATLEYFEGRCVEASRASFPLTLPDDAQFLVVAEADGTAAGAAQLSRELVDVLGEEALLAQTVGGPGMVPALARWRSGVSWAVSMVRGGKVSEDIAVPLDKLAEAIEMTLAVGEEFELPACSWGHAGDGNLHSTFMIDRDDLGSVRRAGAAASELFARTLALGGSVSGEHGLGWIKQDQFEHQFGAAERSLMTAVKRSFDPAGLFNPGKKLPDARQNMTREHPAAARQ